MSTGSEPIGIGSKIAGFLLVIFIGIPIVAIISLGMMYIVVRIAKAIGSLV